VRNGLVGQAWTFEALAEASRLFDDPKYANLAEDVFFQHPFDEKAGLWNRLETDGRVLPFDSAFNHQLWFAACAALLPVPRHEEILRRAHIFLDRTDQTLTVLPDGLLYHPIESLLEQQLAERFHLPNRLKAQVRELLSAAKHFRIPKRLETETIVRKQTRQAQTYKSIGYHAFNMYAFALLKPSTESHPFWDSERFKRMVDYMRAFSFRIFSRTIITG